jgi:hypothetical protein
MTGLAAFAVGFLIGALWMRERMERATREALRRWGL